MQVVALQYDIIWEDPDQNYDQVWERVKSQPPEPGDLLVLPEMFSTGFSMNTQATLEFECEKDRSAEFLRRLASEYQCDVIGGMVWAAQCASKSTKPGNMAVWIGSDGSVRGVYQKICPFSMVGEDQTHEAGREIPIIEWNGIRVAMLICYDLRFPELFRNALHLGAEMFVVIANWPSKRESHWTRLLECRAIENLAYVIGVNRTGTDPGFQYPGRSRIIDPLGEVLKDTGADPAIIRSEIRVEAIREWRKDFPAYQDSLNLQKRLFS